MRQAVTAANSAPSFLSNIFFLAQMADAEKAVSTLNAPRRPNRAPVTFANNLQKPSGRPESPTTARELDFDDEPLDNHQSPPSLAPISEPLQAAGDEGIPPQKPPRPLTPAHQAEITLKDAFPSIDPAVIKAVLQASGWNIEPAFNALLGEPQ